MTNYPAEFWNKMYGADEFRYGIMPNIFFKAQLDNMKPGSILLPAEGEGRNAAYAASQGWNVTAFDISEKGKEKAMRLAKQNDITIDYLVTGALEFQTNKQFDVIGFSYAHFPAAIRKQANQYILQFLKLEGVVVFEAFAKAQLEKSSGGPKNEEMLFSIEEIKDEFQELQFNILKEETIELSEGNYHKGEAEVIRFVGRKLS